MQDWTETVAREEGGYLHPPSSTVRRGSTAVKTIPRRNGWLRRLRRMARRAIQFMDNHYTHERAVWVWVVFLVIVETIAQYNIWREHRDDKPIPPAYSSWSN